jgi:hypothetical protein
MRSLITVAICWLATGIPAQAADDPLQARFVLDAGWFLLSTDTHVRLDGETNESVGTEVDFDESFGIGDTDRLRVDAMWRFAKRHAIRGMYFQNDRSGSRDLSRDVSFGDEVFPGGTTVTGKSEFSVAQLSYDYAFLQRENYEIAGGIGLHMLDVRFGLDATVIGEGGSPDRSLSQTASTQAPLPVLGLRGVWRLSDRLYASALMQYFYIDFDKYTGSLADLKAQIVWQLAPHIGLGIGYNDFRFRFDVDDPGNFEGRLRCGYGGALAFASVTF